jgi:hypothetical protein
VATRATTATETEGQGINNHLKHILIFNSKSSRLISWFYFPEMDNTTHRSTSPLPTTSTSHTNKEPEPEPDRIAFSCESCNLTEKCDYFGRQPPFARKIQFTENCFVMKDPFSPPPSSQSNKSSSEYFLVLGANCEICAKTFCKGAECSLYYSKTFCLTCAKANIQQFPLEIQSKIRKQLAVVVE